MKKYTAFGASFLTTLLTPLFYVFAVTPTITFQNPLQSQSVSQVLLKFFEVMIELGAVAVTLAIVYAGFLFVVARGNPEQLKQARSTLFWTIIGSLVLLGAQVIATIVQNTINEL